MSNATREGCKPETEYKRVWWLAEDTMYGCEHYRQGGYNPVQTELPSVRGCGV